MFDDSSANRCPPSCAGYVPHGRTGRDAPLRVALLAVLLGVAAPLAAQELDLARETAGPSLKLGETDLYPSLRLDAMQVDNIYRTADEEQEGSVTVISPRLLWLARRRLLTLQGSYDGEYAQSSEPVLEHADHTLRLGVEAIAGKRLAGSGEILYRRGHIALGDSFTSGLGTTVDEPVTFDQFELGASGRYGAEQARGNLGFGVRAVGRGYTNLDALTEGRDYTFVQPFGRFSVRVAGDTRLFVEVRTADVDYDSDVRDRVDQSLFGGVTFAATERSLGQFQIGVTETDYDDPAREDESTVVAEGVFRYVPRDYSRLRLLLRREIDNAADAALVSGVSTAVRTYTRLDWAYDWSTRVSHTAFAEIEDIERGCPDPSETSAGLGLELAFSVRRWLDFGAGARGVSRAGDGCSEVESSVADQLDYDLLSFGLFARARL